MNKKEIKELAQQITESVYESIIDDCEGQPDDILEVSKWVSIYLIILADQRK